VTGSGRSTENDAAVATEGDGNDEDGDGEQEETLSVECVGFSNSAFKWAASGGCDSTMKIWDLLGGQCRAICHHDGSVVALRWHVSLPFVATAALDRIVRLWDARSGTLVKEFTGHRDLVLNLSFVPDPFQPGSDIIVSVSDDGTAKVFQVLTAALM